MELKALFEQAKKELHKMRWKLESHSREITWRKKKILIDEALNELETGKARAKVSGNNKHIALTLRPQIIDLLEEIIKSESEDLKIKMFLGALPSKNH